MGGLNSADARRWIADPLPALIAAALAGTVLIALWPSPALAAAVVGVLAGISLSGST